MHLLEGLSVHEVKVLAVVVQILHLLLVQSDALSTLSSEEKRCSIMVPELSLRIFTCTKPRRLPGVRCSILKIEHNSLLNLITIPGRNCVAEIIRWSFFSLAKIPLDSDLVQLVH